LQALNQARLDGERCKSQSIKNNNQKGEGKG
jgi:hypothetical protein